jgi:hypothetical protein
MEFLDLHFIDLHFIDVRMLNISSCIYLPFVLLRTVCSIDLPIY